MLARVVLVVALVWPLVSGTGRLFQRGKARRRANDRSIASVLKAETCALHLVQLRTPKSDILAALDAMATDIRTEQADDDAVFAIGQARIDANVIRLGKAKVGQQLMADAADVALVTDRARLLAASNELAATDEALAQELQQAENVRAQLIVLEATRATSKGKRDAIIARHIESLRLLQQLTAMVTKFDFSEALRQLKRAQTDFLHRRSAPVASLIQSAVVLLDTNTADPDKQKVKASLIALLLEITGGIQHSLQLYYDQEGRELVAYNSERAHLLDLYRGHQGQGVTLSTQVDMLKRQLVAINKSIGEHTNTAADAKASVVSISQLIQDQVQERDAMIGKHDRSTADRRADLNDIEFARRYVLTNVSGMTPGADCHVEAPDCPRCLWSAQCTGGLTCSTAGQCIEPNLATIVDASVPEGSTWTATCPPDAVITDVQFASFGDPTRTAGSGFELGQCNDPATPSIVMNRCLNRNSCSVPATNAVFADGCKGQSKVLSGEVLCTVR